MKAVYAVKKIRMDSESPLTFEQQIAHAPEHYCNGLAEVRAYCGGRLHRCGYGYVGNNGLFEFIVYRIK